MYRIVYDVADLVVLGMVREELLPARERLKAWAAERRSGSGLDRSSVVSTKNQAHLLLLVIQPSHVVRQVLLEAASHEGSRCVPTCEAVVACSLWHSDG